MSVSLRQRIFWWSAGSTLAILLVAFLFVDEAFRATILRNQEENLVTQTRLLAELQSTELADRLDHTVTLAATPTLRAAIETADSLTIRQNLEILVESSPFAWLMLTSRAGELVTATEGAPVERLRDPGTARVLEEAAFYDTGDLWADESRLTQVYATAVLLGPNPMAILLAGGPIGPDEVTALQTATGQRVAFLAGGRIVAGGTGLESPARADLLQRLTSSAGTQVPVGPDAPTDEGEPVLELDLAGEPFIATWIPLPNASGETVGRLVAFRSLQEALAPARTLRISLLLIAIGGVLLALAASYILARRVTKPVNRLLEETVRLGTGDLDTAIQPEADDEIGKLAAGFEQMRVSLRSAREELIRAERLSAVGRAASAIVHDFRQPVMVIQGHVQLLRLDLDDLDAREEDLEVIESQLERLNGMMSEILDFARGGDSIQRTTGSVRELLEQVSGSVQPLFRDRQVSLTVDPRYDGEWVLDYPRMRRVLENLVRNAAAVVGPGGRIAIWTDEEDGHLRFGVEDTGPGIPEEVRSNLFEPFVTFGKKEGTGLGLAIVKTFTEKQGGTVRVETSSAGTRFLLDFPREVAA